MTLARAAPPSGALDLAVEEPLHARGAVPTVLNETVLNELVEHHDSSSTKTRGGR